MKQLHRLAENTGVKVEGHVFAFVFEYGRNFSGPGKDPFREDRASSSVSMAFDSNFLHPVYYNFEKLPDGKSRLMVLSNVNKLPSSESWLNTAL